MEKRVSRNIGDLMLLSSKNFFKTFGRGMLGTLVFILPFLICGAMALAIRALRAYVTFGLIAVVIYAPMHVGYIKYCNSLYNGEKPSVLAVFKGFASKYVVVTALFSIILVLLYALGLALFVVPVLVVIAFFSMSTFYIAKYDCHLEVFKTCFNRMKRNRITMLSYKAVFYLLFLMILILGGLAGFGVYYIALQNMVAGGIIGFIVGLVLLFVFCAYICYYHATNHLQFEEIEYYYEKKQARLAAKAQKAQELESAPEVKEEVSAPAEKKVAKAPAKAKTTKAPVEENAEVKTEVKKTTRTRKTTTSADKK